MGNNELCHVSMLHKYIVKGAVDGHTNVANRQSTLHIQPKNAFTKENAAWMLIAKRFELIFVIAESLLKSLLNEVKYTESFT